VSRAPEDKGGAPDALADAGCPACNARLRGRYCHDCGQDTRIRPRPLRTLAYEAFSETSPIDGKAARTVLTLAVRPGRLLETYRSGASSRYATPIQIFVVMTALFLAVLSFSEVVIYQYVRQVIPGQTVVARADPDGYTVHIEGAVEQERWMQRRVEPDIDPAVTAAIQAAADRAETERDRQNLLYEIQSDREQAIITARLADWLPNAIWLLMPLFAALLMPLFGRRRLFLEHLVFAMWAHATAFGLLIILALANRSGAGLPAWPLLGPYLLYATLAASRYYRLDRWSAAWRVSLHSLLYLSLVLLPAAILVAASAMDLDAFMAFLRAP
jgi:hypothetical protein